MMHLGGLVKEEANRGVDKVSLSAEHLTVGLKKVEMYRNVWASLNVEASPVAERWSRSGG